MAWRLGGGVVLGLLLSGCGPAWAPPNAPTTPCEIVSEARYQAAIDDGAARGRARVYENGVVSLTTGPGIQHCATFSSTMRPCRRPNDYVIEYTQVDGEKFYVLIPANTEYRFNVNAAPNTCQVVRNPGEPHRINQPS